MSGCVRLVTAHQQPPMNGSSFADLRAPDEAVVYYIDGFNNPGFSGGPVLYWEFSSHTYKILAVVKGYRNDTAKILINGKQVETNILVNSGILVSYSIQHAIDAIEKNLAPGAPH